MEGAAVIRDARDDELDEAADVMVAAYDEYIPSEPHPALHAYREDIRDVRARIPVSTLIVAELNGGIVGAVTYFPAGGEDSGWPTGIPAIRLLAVYPSARRRGIGRALTEECLRRARASGASAVGLHTTEMMAIAGAMYGRMGFRREPDRDFRPSPDIHVMGYRLEL